MLSFHGLLCTKLSDSLPPRSVSSQPSHPSCISVLVSDLLLHFSISQGFQEWRPDVSFTLIPECILNRWHLGLRKHISFHVPCQLASDGVQNSSDKLSPKPQISTNLPGEILWAVCFLSQIPLKLINYTDVSNMNVQLDDNSLVPLLLQ